MTAQIIAQILTLFWLPFKGRADIKDDKPAKHGRQSSFTDYVHIYLYSFLGKTKNYAMKKIPLGARSSQLRSHPKHTFGTLWVPCTANIYSF